MAAMRLLAGDKWNSALALVDAPYVPRTMVHEHGHRGQQVVFRDQRGQAVVAGVDAGASDSVSFVVKPRRGRKGDRVYVREDLPRYLPRSMIVQDYVSPPALHLGRKFDVRYFAVVLDGPGYERPRLVGVPYAYMRVAAAPYTARVMSREVHVSNVSIGATTVDISATTPGWAPAFEAMERCAADAYGRCQQRVEETETYVRSAPPQVQVTLLGFDFIATTGSTRVMFIEANLGPGMSTNAAETKRKMVEHVVDVVVAARGHALSGAAVLDK